MTQEEADIRWVAQQKRDQELKQYFDDNGIGFWPIDGTIYKGDKIGPLIVEYFEKLDM